MHFSQFWWGGWPGVYYTEWSKAEREKQILHIHVYIWSLERWYWQTYLPGNNGDADMERRLMDTDWGRRRGQDEWREEHGNTHTSMCKADNQWECAAWLRELKPGLWDTGEEGGEVGGRLQWVGTHARLWLIHADVWQKPTQYCEAIFLQLKIGEFKHWFWGEELASHPYDWYMTNHN